MPSKKQMAGKAAIGKMDILIPVMGPTGAGKSYFINTVLRDDRMLVGTDLDSCTAELDVGYIEKLEGYPSLKDRRIVLIDTPGFDDTNKDDYEILEKIATWLKEANKKGAKIGGVVYLHDITNDRFSGTARRNLRLFQDLCGDDALKNVVLATTKWSRKNNDSEKHQQQLEAKHWKYLIDRNAQVRRFDQGYESAWAIIDTIITLGEKRAVAAILQIQSELVKDKKIIPETQAATALRNDLQRALDLQKKLLSKSAAPTSQEERAELEEAHKLVTSLLDQMRKLKIPFSRRLKRLLGLS